MTEPTDEDPSTPRLPTLSTIHSQTVDRRTVLKLSGLITTISLAGCTGVGPGTKTKRIRLSAEAAGWTGRQPANIQGIPNPTLELTTGTTYDLTWENIDGKKHELVITDDSGTELKSTDPTKHKGATQTTAFTAEPKMMEYHDPYHPDSMHGEIRVDTG